MEIYQIQYHYLISIIISFVNKYINVFNTCYIILVRYTKLGNLVVPPLISKYSNSYTTVKSNNIIYFIDENRIINGFNMNINKYININKQEPLTYNPCITYNFIDATLWLLGGNLFNNNLIGSNIIQYYEIHMDRFKLSHYKLNQKKLYGHMCTFIFYKSIQYIFNIGGIIQSNIYSDNIDIWSNKQQTFSISQSKLTSSKALSSIVNIPNKNDDNYYIYIIGGINSNGNSINSIDIIDIKTMTVTSGNPLNIPRHNTFSVYNPRNYKLYVFGGYNNNDCLNSTEIMDIRQQSSTSTKTPIKEDISHDQHPRLRRPFYSPKSLNNQQVCLYVFVKSMIP